MTAVATMVICCCSLHLTHLSLFKLTITATSHLFITPETGQRIAPSHCRITRHLTMSSNWPPHLKYVALSRRRVDPPSRRLPLDLPPPPRADLLLLLRAWVQESLAKATSTNKDAVNAELKQVGAPLVLPPNARPAVVPSPQARHCSNNRLVKSRTTDVGIRSPHCVTH